MDLPKPVADRSADGRSLLNAGLHYMDRIQMGADARYGAAAGAHLVELLDPVLGEVKTRLDALLEATERHLEELLRQPPLRASRDTDTDAQHDDLMRLRGFVQLVYGEDTVRDLGLDGRIPSDPRSVHAVTQRMIDRARKLILPRPRLPVQVRFADLVAPIELRNARLGSALDKLSREDKPEDTALVARHRAMDAYDEAFEVAATLLSGLLLAVGETTLADVLRPATGRPGRTAGDPDRRDALETPEEPAAAAETAQS